MFGLKEYVKLQGFVSECAQETAIGGKYLRRLVEIVLPFTEGAESINGQLYHTNWSKG